MNPHGTKLCASPSLTMLLCWAFPGRVTILEHIAIIRLYCTLFYLCTLLLFYYLTVTPCYFPSITCINGCGAVYRTKTANTGHNIEPSIDFALAF
jgi:hypothetical protein